MKKLLFLLLGVAVAAFVGCNSEDDPIPATQFSLQSQVVDAAAEGGAFTMSYTLEHPKAGVEVEASCVEEWITNLDASAQGVITFNVEPNPASEPRTAVVVVSYDQQEYPFTVNQAEYKVVYEAPFTYALSFGGGDFQFQLAPSNHLVNYDLLPNSSYYTFNIFTDPNNLPTNPKCYDLPAGRYTIDPTNSGAVGTAYANENSFLLMTDSNCETSVIYFTAGTILIDEHGVRAEVFTEDGIKHVVTGGKHLHESSSTINEDMNITFSSSTEVSVTYKGDYYDYDYAGAKANYEVELKDPTTMAILSLDLISDNDMGVEGIPTGSYPVYQPAYSDPFTGNATLPGAMYGASYVYPSFAAFFDENEQLTGVSLLAAGEVIISLGADQTYTIEIAARNDLHDAKAITAKWSGTIEIVDGTTPSEEYPPLPPVPPAPPLP